MAQHDKAEEKLKTYQFDPHLDPTLQWAGKAEGTSFDPQKARTLFSV